MNNNINFKTNDNNIKIHFLDIDSKTFYRFLNNNLITLEDIFYNLNYIILNIEYNMLELYNTKNDKLHKYLIKEIRCILC